MGSFLSFSWCRGRVSRCGKNSRCVWIDLGKSLVSQILGVVRRKEWTERAKAQQRMWWRFRTGKSSKSCEGKRTEEMLSSKRRGFGRGIIVYFILRIHFFGSLLLLLLFFAFAVFLLFRRCSLCCFCRAE